MVAKLALICVFLLTSCVIISPSAHQAIVPGDLSDIVKETSKLERELIQELKNYTLDISRIDEGFQPRICAKITEVKAGLKTFWSWAILSGQRKDFIKTIETRIGVWQYFDEFIKENINYLINNATLDKSIIDAIMKYLNDLDSLRVKTDIWLSRQKVGKDSWLSLSQKSVHGS